MSADRLTRLGAYESARCRFLSVKSVPVSGELRSTGLKLRHIKPSGFLHSLTAGRAFPPRSSAVSAAVSPVRVAARQWIPESARAGWGVGVSFIEAKWPTFKMLKASRRRYGRRRKWTGSAGARGFGSSCLSGRLCCSADRKRIPDEALC
ncbi:hypothetical protein SKAU_G00202250 [Synaphobranchus kaupii]|uniref:Uncharacterized protein n=1 Tax=Synaphobranchus kaupii TaxID=118154 RepID=A0A9Q1IXZ1_SYNKA|nr:hypothetical protein SKAU_G00202250 [Synaphobranchus kaupii]